MYVYVHVHVCICILILLCALFYDSFCGNYAKHYFDAKHLEKRIKYGVVKLKWSPFFKVPFLASIGRCPIFLDYASE